jgi:hypothetical protein
LSLKQGDFKMKDATKDGVSTEEEVKISGTGHADELENIVVSRENVFEEDSGLKLDREDAEEETEEEAEEDTETTEEKTDKIEEPAETEEPTDEKVKIVVDGEEREVPLSEIKDAGIRSLQKESAADKRLEEATKLLKEAQEVKTQPPEKEPDVEEEDVSTEPDELKDAEAELAKKRQAHRDAIQYGTDEEVEEAMIAYESALRTVNRIEAGASRPDATQNNLSVDDVVDKLEERKVIKKFHLSPEEGGFKDLTDDPVLRNACLLKVDELLESGEPGTWETYEKAGNLVREKYVTGPQPPETDVETTDDKPTSTDNLETKLERKREIDNIPAANAKTESTLKPAEQKKPSEIVEEIRQSRPGQHI